MATSHLFKQVEEQGAKWREEQGKARDPLQNPLAKAALAAGLGYITGGVLPALLPGGTTVAAAGPATAAGVGATADIGLPAAIGAGLTPSVANVLPAIEAGLQGATAASPEEAAITGLKSGVQPTKEAYKQKLLGDKLKGMGLPKTPSTATVDKEGNISSTYKPLQPIKGMTEYQKQWLALQEKKLQKGKTSSSSSSTKDNLSNYTPEELKRAKMNALASGMSWNRLKENEKLSFAKDARNNPAPTIAPTATPENKDPAGLGI